MAELITAVTTHDVRFPTWWLHGSEEALGVLRRYVAPLVPGPGARLRPEAMAEYGYPDGPQWAGRARVLS